MSRPPRVRLVGGKGGVGKTTLAAAWALARVEAGERVLLVSTDPAHSLGDVLDEPLGDEPRGVPSTRNRLLAAEPTAAPAWRRWLGTRRGELVRLAEQGMYLDRDHAEALLDLPVPGVDELIGWVEVSRLAQATDVSEVVVDTAPTAHTLRLLSQPRTLARFGHFLEALAEKHRVVAEHLVGSSVDPSAESAAHEVAAEAERLGELLRDPDRTRCAWVLLAEELSLAESRDALGVLSALGVRVDRLWVNRLVAPPDGPCPSCRSRWVAQSHVLEQIEELWPDVPIRRVPEQIAEPVGRGALDRLADLLAEPDDALPSTPNPDPVYPAPGKDPRKDPKGSTPVPPGAVRSVTTDLLRRIAPPGLSLLFVGGKGGVGKSSVATALALLLVRHRPEHVLLMSTDPAHSLADLLDLELGDAPKPVPVPGAVGRLTARELSAETAYEGRRQRLRQHLLSFLRAGDRSGGAELGLDRAVLERLLEAVPPGLDELEAVAVLADAAASGHQPDEPALVVIDTAPTGHTLQLLEMPEVALAWVHTLMSILLESRQALGLGTLAEELLSLARRLKTLRCVLGDPSHTRFLPVTRAAELPRRETTRLLDALDRLGIAAPVVAINAPARPADESCPRCRARRKHSTRQPAESIRRDGDRAILDLPEIYPPPRGIDALLRWGESFTFGGSEP